MNQQAQTYRNYLSIGSIGVLLILHTVGLFGIASASQDWFLALTPLTLLISGALLLVNHKDWNGRFVAVALLCLCTGFFVEVAGVHTGWIFGSYSYGQTLGLKVLDVPLVIGMNWLILVYCTGVMVAGLRMALPLRAALAAAMMTGLDLLLEPVAMRYDFWQWAGETVPLRNYLAWFCIAFGLLLVFQGLKFEKQNRVAPALFVIQCLFFGILNVIP